MVLTETERAQRHRALKNLKSISVTEDTRYKLKAYQQRWELPSLSVAVDHAVTFSKPE